MRGDTRLPRPAAGTEGGGDGEEPGPLLERMGLLPPDALEGEVDPPHVLGEEEPGAEREVGLGRELAGLQRKREARATRAEPDREPARTVEVGVVLDPDPPFPGIAGAGATDVDQRLVGGAPPLPDRLAGEEEPRHRGVAEADPGGEREVDRVSGLRE